MISNLSKIIFNSLFIEKTDTQEDVDVYQFALFIIISNTIYFFISLIVGILFSSIIEMILFYFSFLFLRVFSGGYHSKSEIKCELLSTVCIFLTGLIIWSSKSIILIRLILVLTSFLSCCMNFIFSPVEAEEKPLTKEERKKYRRISLSINFTIILVIIITYIYKLKFIYTPCCLSLILESILLLIGKHKEFSYHEQ